MKTWVTYLASIAMGFATALLFKDLEGAFNIFQSATYFLVNLSLALFIPVVLITFSSGVASLRKDKVGFKMSWGIFGWAIVTSVILPLVAVAAYKIYPMAFPVTSTAGSDASSLPSIVVGGGLASLSELYPSNPFYMINYTTTFLLPLIIIAWILGISLRPSSDIIRPAYTVMNSFAEVMYRITRTVATIGSALSYFAATYFFLDLYREKTVLAVPEFAIFLSLTALFVLVAVLPLIYALFTGFRKNPYSIIGNSLSSLALGLVTANIITADLVGESISRQNGGAQKRVVSVATPIFTIVGRGGAGFISTLSALMLIHAITGEAVSTSVALVVAAAAMLASFTSSVFMGFETIAIVYIILSMLKINTYGAEMTIVALLPLLGGLGTMLDSAINNLGAVIASFFIGTDVKVPYSETI